MNPPTAPPKPRVLVVDDEEIVLAALRETLLRAGYDVVAVPNALRALEVLPTTPFAVIISDHQMPRMTGLDFLAQAKAIQPEASRILITAVLTLGTVIEAINSGEIFRFIVKPWLREELLATVQNAVQRHELLRRNAELQSATQQCNVELTTANQSLAEQVRRAEADRTAQREQLQQAVEISVRALNAAHPLLGARARRVHEICRSLMATLNLSESEQRTLEWAAWLHDLGLLAAPRDLVRRWLQEPATLTDDDRSVLRLHPAAGQEIVSTGSEWLATGQVIRAHHEHFDGSGFPDGLAGEQIPWLARLLTVAAAFAEHPQSDSAALEQIKLASGAQFDPEAVRALLRVLPGAPLGRKEREVLLGELQPGMIVASAIYTAHGLLLVPAGQPLSEPTIEKLKSHDHTVPLTQSLLVYC